LWEQLTPAAQSEKIKKNFQQQEKGKMHESRTRPERKILTLKKNLAKRHNLIKL
jgi:hypothetical protein